jgi:NodT family efflux transporter outer membrane factor (OMF) lipoprotein
MCRRLAATNPLNKARRALSATLLCAAGGCAAGPNYQTPTPPPGASAPLVSVTPAAETTANPPDNWWQLYHDPFLDQLLAEALAANTELRIATANLVAARSVLEAARVGRYPQTDAGVGATFGRDSKTDEILELDGHQPKNIWIFDPLLDISYEVDIFGRVRRSIEAARADAEASIAARDGVKITVVAETTRAYTQICALGEQIAVAQHSLEVVRREAQITSERRDAGAGSQLDVVRAQGLVAQVNSDIPPLQGARRAALFELAALLGRTPSQAPVQVDTCVSPPPLPQLLPVGDGATLLKRRPDVREAERRLAAATARIGVATADLYPTVVLKGFLGGISTQFNQLASNNALTWGVGPTVSWSFPNQALPRARIRQAKAGTAAALAAFDSTVLQALKETEQDLARYAADLDRRQSLLEAQDKARQALDMSHAQFIAGAVTGLDLLIAEQTLVSADAAVAASDAILTQDQIAVFKALGGGWASHAHS